MMESLEWQTEGIRKKPDWQIKRIPYAHGPRLMPHGCFPTPLRNLSVVPRWGTSHCCQSREGSRAEGAGLGIGCNKCGKWCLRKSKPPGKGSLGQSGNTDNRQLNLAGITLEESEQAAAASPDERLHLANAKPFCQDACF